MKSNMNSLCKKGWQFIVIVLFLSTIPYYFIISEGSTESNWTLLLMWMPALAAIIMRLTHKEGIFKGMSWNPLKNFKVLLLAAFLPFVIEWLAALIGIWLGSWELKPEFISINDGMVVLRGNALLLGASSQPWYVFIPNYLMSYFVGTLLYSVAFALGEEFGWRGYLQKEWAPKNALFGFAAIGIIWGLWHFPGVLLGHNYPEYPILGGLILMPFVTTIFSVCFGIYYNKTNIIWVPVIFHGAVNISSEMTNVAIIEASINHTVTDVIWTSLWLLAGIVVWLKRDRN
jgi:membrane protease YdiL (CAAX protease family)